MFFCFTFLPPVTGGGGDVEEKAAREQEQTLTQEKPGSVSPWGVHVVFSYNLPFFKIMDFCSRSAFMWAGMHHRLSVAIMNCMHVALEL